jgi:ribose 5-phosphate isomerase A
MAMTQDELKALVGRAAADYVAAHVGADDWIGVGTGSTVDKFIDALGPMKGRFRGAVSSSVRSTARLEALGIRVVDASVVESLPVYVDGADEIDHAGHMIKGGGAALTREKIVADLAQRFVCIADESKLVATLGAFALPVEVIPMAVPQVIRRFAAAYGAQARRREGVVTDNGQAIVDVKGLSITDPAAMEAEINQWPGVVTCGIFARHTASVLLLATPQGVKTMGFGGA